MTRYDNEDEYELCENVRRLLAKRLAVGSAAVVEPPELRRLAKRIDDVGENGAGQPVAVRPHGQPHHDHHEKHRHRLGDAAGVVRVHEQSLEKAAAKAERGQCQRRPDGLGGELGQVRIESADGAEPAVGQRRGDDQQLQAEHAQRGLPCEASQGCVAAGPLDQRHHDFEKGQADRAKQKREAVECREDGQRLGWRRHAADAGGEHRLRREAKQRAQGEWNVKREEPFAVEGRLGGLRPGQDVANDWPNFPRDVQGLDHHAGGDGCRGGDDAKLRQANALGQGVAGEQH